MRALVGTYVRALTCSHKSVYVLCKCGRACVCASGCVRVSMRACVSACVRACLRARIYVCMIIVLYYYCGAR